MTHEHLSGRAPCFGRRAILRLGAATIGALVAGAVAGCGGAAPDPLTPQLTELMASPVAANFTGSVLVARKLNGRPVVALSTGKGAADRAAERLNTPQTRFRIGSVSKQFTAFAILALQHRGALQLSDPILRHLDGPAAWGAISIHHLLSHTSGIPNFTDLPADPSFDPATASIDANIARFRDLPLEFSPGERWAYSNSGYVLLGRIIERVSGQPYGSFVREAICAPLGLSETGYDTTKGLAVGYRHPPQPAPAINLNLPYAAGALYSTVEDLYRWSLALDTDNAVMPRSAFAVMFEPQASTSVGGGLSYGYGWFVGSPIGRRVEQHDGDIEGFSALHLRLPDEGVKLIILSNQEHAEVQPLFFAILQTLGLIQ